MPREGIQILPPVLAAAWPLDSLADDKKVPRRHVTRLYHNNKIIKMIMIIVITQ